MYKNIYCPHCTIALKEKEKNYHCLNCSYSLWNIQDILTQDKNFIPKGFSTESQAHLNVIETTHFWFKSRHKLLNHLSSNLLDSKKELKILELGCGNGLFLPVLEKFSSTIVGIDGHYTSLSQAKKNAPNALLIHSDIHHIPYPHNYFDFICAFDVLEHVEPLTLLKEAYQKLKPKGKILLSVPAFDSLWSEVDVKAGHRCRYSKKRLETELESCGFKLLGYTHYQFLLFPLLWIVRKLISTKGRSSTEAQPSWVINQIFNFINQLEVHLFSSFTLPYGSSLIVWAEPIKGENFDYAK